MAFPVTFLHAKHMTRCDARVDKHFDGYHTLQFISRGAVELFYNNTRHVVRAPAFWTCYPGPLIRFHVHGGRHWEHRYAAVRGPGVLDWQERGLFFRGVQACPARHAVACAAAMDEVIRRIHAPGAFSAQRAANLLERLLLDIAEWRQDRAQAETWLTTVLEALESSAPATPDYGALARQCGIGLSTLRRRFQREIGVPLHHHALEWRIARACRLVGFTDRPFKEIAEELGYDNVFYFSRQFRKFQGVAPLVYRRARQG
jgi:AraC-like DNA-binding protein